MRSYKKAIHGITKIGSKMKWNMHESRAVLEERLANRIIEILSKSITENGMAKLLVSGGSTPLALFEILSQKELDWAKVAIALVDDRLDPAYSNETMLQERLLNNQASSANYISLIDIENGIRDTSLIGTNLSSFKEGIDCVILGMGTDKHTASIFPEDAASMAAMKDESSKEMIVYTTAPSAPLDRVSFRPNVLSAAKNILLHINGEVKKMLLSDVEINKNQDDSPIGYFVKKGRLEVYYAD